MRHDPSAPFGRDLLSRRDELGDRPRAIALLLAVMALKLAYLATLGRPLGCDCGLVWALPDDPALNSRVLLDPYTLMHLIAGALLVKLLGWLRPDWSLWTVMLAVVVSSTVWEAVENTPVVIAAFGYDPGDPLDYQGDSILNAMADGLAVTAGALAALRLPLAPVLLAALAGELGLSLWIGDGFAIVLLRALGLWS